MRFIAPLATYRPAYNIPTASIVRKAHTTSTSHPSASAASTTNSTWAAAQEACHQRLELFVAFL